MGEPTGALGDGHSAWRAFRPRSAIEIFLWSTGMAKRAMSVDSMSRTSCLGALVGSAKHVNLGDAALRGRDHARGSDRPDLGERGLNILDPNAGYVRVHFDPLLRRLRLRLRPTECVHTKRGIPSTLGICDEQCQPSDRREEAPSGRPLRSCLVRETLRGHTGG